MSARLMCAGESSSSERAARAGAAAYTRSASTIDAGRGRPKR